MSLARKRRTDRSESEALPHVIQRSTSDDEKVSLARVMERDGGGTGEHMMGQDTKDGDGHGTTRHFRPLPE